MPDKGAPEGRRGLYAGGALLLAALIWGSSFPIGKLCLEFLPPVFMVAVRCLVTGLLLLPFCLGRIRRLPKRELLGCILMGTVFVAAYGCQITGLKYTSSATQAFVAALYIIFVPFFLWLFFRRRPSWFDAASVILALGGMYLLTVRGVSGFNIGDALTVGSAVLYAIHIILIGRYAASVDPVTMSCVQFLVAGILAVPFVPFFGGLPKELPAGTLLGFIYIILVCTVAAYILQIFGQKYTEENSATIILSLESVFGTLLSVILLGDTLSPAMLTGCALMFLAFITTQTKWAFLFKRKAAKKAEKEITERQ